MIFFSKKRLIYLLLFFSWFVSSPVFADESAEEGTESDRFVLLRAGKWEIRAGGQVRLRGDFVWNQDFTKFTFAPGHNEAQLLERTRLQASIENRSLNFELFVQGQWYGRWGGTDSRSDFDLYQGYIEWGKVLNLPVTLKAGRQEFVYGSAFFIGANDFYNGLTWDGFKTSIRPLEQLVVDFLGAKMAKLNPTDPDIYLTGLYAIDKIYKEGSLEGYFFYTKGGFPIFHREFVLVDSGQSWFTLGGRLAGKLGRFDYELEPQFQWGRVTAMGDANAKVRAYGGHLDLGYTFKLPWEPRLFGKYAYGSGDNNPFDKTYREFHGSIFNDDSDLFGDMRVVTDQSGVTVSHVHASGLQIWVGGLQVTPFSRLGITLRAHRFLANRVPSGFSRDIGTEFDSEISYQLSKKISFLLGVDRFFTGRFFKQASGSGKDIHYIYLQAQLDF